MEWARSLSLSVSINCRASAFHGIPPRFFFHPLHSSIGLVNSFVEKVPELCKGSWEDPAYTTCGLRLRRHHAVRRR